MLAMSNPATGDVLIFFCNGVKITEKNVDTRMTLDVYLRTKLRLSGTKQGCGEGGCGACTVMVSAVDPHTQNIRHISVVSCLMPVCLLHGKAITTIEGIGNTRTRLHAVQERLAKSHGSQCGFCSPGMVMSMYTLLRNNPKPDVSHILRYLEGNLCRCTGYRPILDGFKSFCGENCCQITGGSCQSNQENQESNQGVEGSELTPHDPTQEPIFPPELLTNSDDYHRTLTFISGQCKWIVASSLEELLQLKAQNPSAQLVTGNTGIGVIRKCEGVEFPLVLSPGAGVKELTQVTLSDTGVTVGSGVTVSQLEEQLQKLVDQLPEDQARSLKALLEMIEWFAGQQVRNMASIGGSIASASGLLDLCIVLMATKTMVTLVKTNGGRCSVPLDKDFYPEPNQSVIAADEIIEAIHIPFTSKYDYVFCHKVAQRRHNSRSAVSCGFRVTFEPEGHKVIDLCLVFGGVEANPAVALKTCNSLIGQPWSQSLLQDAIQSVSSEIFPDPNKFGLSAEYRQSLMSTCLLRFYVRVSQLIGNAEGLMGGFAQGQLSDSSLPDSYNRDGPVSTQMYTPPPQDQPDADPIGRPIIHRAALQQCSGEAQFTGDIPPVEDELHLAMVVSSRAHAKIISIDASEALAIDGVEDFIGHADIPGKKDLIGNDILAIDEVHCVGQPIGGIVATSHELAVKAARLVRVQYEDLQPVILTLQQAIKEGSGFEEDIIEFGYGDLEGSMEQADGILEGEFNVGGQEHFYMETHACLIRPGEDEEMEVHASTQDLKGVQESISNTLGVPRNRINCQAKRLGGAFGGKEEQTRPYITCAVAAKKLHRSVRLQLPRSSDMLITGGRHPFHAKYRVGYRGDGRILALEIKLYCDAGYINGTSIWVMRQAVVVMGCLYLFSGFQLTGTVCRTNKPPNTALRGFGAPQSLAIMEHIISEVGIQCGVSGRKVREINFKPNDHTLLERFPPVDMQILRDCWETCLRLSDYENRLREIDDYNSKHRWKKHGLAIVPTMHGIGPFGGVATMQAGALVHIYTDGSVLVNHGGIEMGQGLYTKIIQVASRVLDIPVDKIHTSATATDKVPNATMTGGSFGTDLYGPAVKAACEILKERLEPFKTANPKGKWEDWVRAAYMDRVSLSTTGYYKKPSGSMDWTKGNITGNPYHYCTLGVGVSEVEVDCLTGQHQLLRTDIVMDLGKSLNPAIDVGQIEGGFVQGYGYFTMEEIRFNNEGAMLSDGPDTYKIPTAGDIPKQINVTLLRNLRTPENHLYSSKGIGEPPFFLGATAFYAIKHALSSARADNGLNGVFKFNAPATIENVRRTCGDLLVK